MAIFNTKGYRATSLSDITKATGMTKGAIYGNFENKEDVADASYEFAIQKVLDELRIDIKAANTAPLKLKAIVNYYENYIHNPPIEGGCPIINTAVEADDNNPSLRSKVLRTMQILKDSFAKITYRGITEKQLTADIKVDQFTNLFYSTITGAIMISRVEGDLQSYKLIKKQLFKIIDGYTLK